MVPKNRCGKGHIAQLRMRTLATYYGWIIRVGVDAPLPSSRALLRKYQDMCCVAVTNCPPGSPGLRWHSAGRRLVKSPSSTPLTPVPKVSRQAGCAARIYLEYKNVGCVHDEGLTRAPQRCSFSLAPACGCSGAPRGGRVKTLIPAVRVRPHWRGLLWVASMPDRVVVFLDYQNAYRGARRAFHAPVAPHWCGQIDPMKLARHLTADSPFDRALTSVRIYRGHPDGTRDPRGYAANRRQLAQWATDPLVDLTVRPLRYPLRWPNCQLGERPQEKGIDVALALDAAVMAVRGEYDVGIVMSTDTDLKPVLEFVTSLTNPANKPRIEVAAWSGDTKHSPRLSIPTGKVYCHWVGKDVYNLVSDRTDFSSDRT
jgi:hypothetical protein